MWQRRTITGLNGCDLASNSGKVFKDAENHIWW